MFLCSNMISTSEMTFEKRFKALMRNYQAVRSSKTELEKQNEYLQKQLGNDMKQKQNALESPATSVYNDEVASNLNSSSSEEEPLRRVRGARRTPQDSNDFKVEIPEFEGKLDLDESLEWLHTVERVFDYEDIPDNKHPFGGLTFVLREPETEKEKSKPRRKWTPNWSPDSSQLLRNTQESSKSS